MRAGKLDRRIQINSMTESQDSSYGSIVKTPGVFATVFAEWIPAPGTEQMVAGAMRARRLGTFKIRPLAGLTSKMTITYGGVTYNIRDINDGGARSRFLHVAVEAEGA